MKIPTTPPGNAPFYHGPPVNGIEMNPQWQGNGIVIDGNPPGNGAAYIMPHHVHPAGFMPPAGYYAPGASPPAQAAGPPVQQDFAEYMWMENEEEFDKQVMQQLEEEALMEQCIEAMLADEQEARNRQMQLSLEEQVSKSTLNPLAAEFVPSFIPAPLAIPGTSGDQDPQPGVSMLSSNTPKSIESSMSELSISQTSDAPTESSKSSGEALEELSNLPLDTTAKQETDKDESNSKKSSDEQIVTVVSMDATKQEKTETAKLSKNENNSKKTETKSKDALKSTKPEKPTSTNKNTNIAKTQEIKSETVGKRNETPSIKSNQNKNQSHTTKPKPEAKTKESEVKMKSSTENIVEQTATPTTPEIEKATTSVAPPVFNYAAAARANLPPKQASQTTSQPSVPVSAPVSSQQSATKQESVRKEPQTNPQNQSSALSAPKAQTKQPAKQVKPPGKDNKDVSKGPASTRGGNSGTGTKKNKK